MKNKKSIAREIKKTLLCSQTLDGLHSIPSLLPNTVSPKNGTGSVPLSLSFSPSSGAQRGWICVTQIFLFWTVTHIIFTYLNSLRFIGIERTNEISLWQWCTLLDERERERDENIPVCLLLCCHCPQFSISILSWDCFVKLALYRIPTIGLFTTDFLNDQF